MGIFGGIKDAVSNVAGGLFGGGNPLGALVGGLGGGILSAFAGSNKGKIPDWLEDVYKAQAAETQDILGMNYPNPGIDPFAPNRPLTNQLLKMGPGMLESAGGAFQQGLDKLTSSQPWLDRFNPAIGTVGTGEIVNQTRALMNPYIDDVIGGVQSDLDRARREAIQGEENRRIGAGTYGGGRHGVADSLTNRDYLSELSGISSRLRSSGFQNAMDTAMQNIARQQGVRRGDINARLGKAGMQLDLAKDIMGAGGQLYGYGTGLQNLDQALADRRWAQAHQNRTAEGMWPITRLAASQGMVPQAAATSFGGGGGGGGVMNILSGALAGANVGSRLGPLSGGGAGSNYFRRVASMGPDFGNFFG